MASNHSGNLLDLWYYVQCGDASNIDKTLAAFSKDDIKQLDWCDEFGNTIIHTTISLGLYNAVLSMLKSGASVDVCDGSGHTPLMSALLKNKFDIAKLLLAERPRDHNLDFADSQGRTYLHVASFKGVSGIVEMLIELGANVNAVCRRGWTALHYATATNNSAVVEILLRNGAKIDAVGAEGHTALHIAASYGFDKIIQLLLETYKANPNAVAIDGQTPLHLAVRSLNQPAVRTLVENDAYIHHSDSSGQTPIDLASSSRSLTKIIVGIQSKITTDASQCHIIDHYPVYVVNRALGFLIEARDAHSRRRAQGGDTVSVTIKHATVIEAIIESNVKDLKNGTYQVIWRTNTPGNHQVSVKINGKEISGSPFEVTIQKQPDNTYRRLNNPVLSKFGLQDSRRRPKSVEIDSAYNDSSYNYSPFSMTQPNLIPSKSAATIPSTHTAPTHSLPTGKKLRGKSRKRTSAASSEDGEESTSSRNSLTADTQSQEPELTRQKTFYAAFRPLKTSSSSDESKASSETTEPENSINRLQARTKATSTSGGSRVQSDQDGQRLSEKVAELQQQVRELQETNQTLQATIAENKEKLRKLAQTCIKERKNQRCLTCSQPRNTVLVPCLHFAYCAACAEEFTSCPLCQTPLKRTLQVKFPQL